MNYEDRTYEKAQHNHILRSLAMSRQLFTPAASIALLMLAPAVHAIPIDTLFENDARCDGVANRFLTHELGEAAGGFPINELISSSAVLAGTVCVSDGDPANDWQVTITNLSAQTWRDLFFVADGLMRIGNADGTVTGISPPDAFRIDAVGAANSNLLSESLIADGLFAPGESWVFLVTDFTHSRLALGTPPIPAFGSIGIGGSSDKLSGSTASIIANPVPVPAAVWLFGSSLGLLGWIRRRSAKVAWSKPGPVSDLRTTLVRHTRAWLRTSC